MPSGCWHLALQLEAYKIQRKMASPRPPYWQDVSPASSDAGLTSCQYGGPPVARLMYCRAPHISLSDYCHFDIATFHRAELRYFPSHLFSFRFGSLKHPRLGVYDVGPPSNMKVKSNTKTHKVGKKV